MTFEAVPPALLPTSTMPATNSGDKPIALETKKADSGITKYWSKTPIKTIAGDLITSLKFDHCKVIPMPNMTTASRGIMAGFSPENMLGKKNAIVEKIIAHSGKSLVNQRSIT